MIMKVSSKKAPSSWEGGSSWSGRRPVAACSLCPGIRSDPVVKRSWGTVNMSSSPLRLLFFLLFFHPWLITWTRDLIFSSSPPPPHHECLFRSNNSRVYSSRHESFPTTVNYWHNWLSQGVIWSWTEFSLLMVDFLNRRRNLHHQIVKL